ncbi:MAG: class I SAM-dependent methyltransferase [Patescibacteria group bacterium]
MIDLDANNQEREKIVRDMEAERYDEWYLTKGILYDLVEKKNILDVLNLQPNDVVLDAGCGTGRFTTIIARKCKMVYAVDFSMKSIEVLNKKLLKEKIYNVKTIISDITRPLPIKNEKFDKIVSIQVIQHIPTLEKRYSTLKNLYNLLKPEGVCVVTVYNWNKFFEAKGFLKEGKFSNGLYYFRFTKEEIEKLFKNCGFKDIEVRGIVNFKWYFLLNQLGIYRLFYPIALLDTFLSKFEISKIFGEYLICKGIKKG